MSLIISRSSSLLLHKVRILLQQIIGEMNVTLDDLKELLWRWNASSREFRPDWYVIEIDFKGAR